MHKNWETIPGTDKPILFKCLSDFWDNFKMFNDRNTVIVEDSSVYVLQKSTSLLLDHIPKFEDLQLSEISHGLLIGKHDLAMELAAMAECRHQYAMDH